MFNIWQHVLANLVVCTFVRVWERENLQLQVLYMYSTDLTCSWCLIERCKRYILFVFMYVYVYNPLHAFGSVQWGRCVHEAYGMGLGAYRHLDFLYIGIVI